jgi:hypothetical protein
VNFANEVPVRSTAWLLLLSLFACYLTLAPATVDGRGYVFEDRQATLDLLTSFNAWIKGRPVPPLTWTRHGPVPLLLDIPFVRIGKAFVSPDFMLSLEPILLTPALLAITYLWLRTLSTPGMSLLLTLIGAFGTMLWPYAYIGLETKQSFFVLLAGYLALGRGRMRTWPQLLLFAIAGGLAITVKSTGIILAPAIAYLIFEHFRHDWRSRWRQALAVSLTIAGIFLLSVVGWRMFWTPRGGGVNEFQKWMFNSTFQLFTNPISIFGSPNKGLFVFAPVLLLAVYVIPRTLKTHREITIFSLLVTAGIVALLSVLLVTADETWGQRFMHVAIAPMLVVIGAAWPRFEWRKHIPLLVLGGIGVAVSFLGAFYFYGWRADAAEASGQNTLEWLISDPVWNEVVFEARVFNVWIKGGTEPVYWTPWHVWAWAPPKDAPAWKTVNLRNFSKPQSLLLDRWNDKLSGSDLVIFRICFVSLIVGPVLLLYVIGRTVLAVQSLSRWERPARARRVRV